MYLSPVGWVLITFLVIIVIGINLSLLNVYRCKGSKKFEKGFLKNVAGQLKNPWEEEDRSLAELSQRVARLKSEKDREEPPQDVEI